MHIYFRAPVIGQSSIKLRQRSTRQLPAIVVRQLEERLTREWVADFTVDDLLDSFLCNVVSGAGFSDEQRSGYYHDAAAVLGVPRKSLRAVNLARITPEQIDGLDAALFYRGYASYQLLTPFEWTESLTSWQDPPGLYQLRESRPA